MSTNSNLTPDPNPTPQPNKKKKRKPSAFADFMQDWEALLSAVVDHGTDLARVEPQRAALADSLDKVRQAKATQASHAATKQTTTQSLKELVTEGTDRARRLRDAVRAELGTTTERLTQFGILPLRRKPPRHKDDPTPAPQPEVQATKVVKGAQ
ncbi:MAG TPA: hypothetical protein VFE33_21355 [Thermoanaerobaculia bacterium]|nr:hypothetical protein [Thermoanaerobaculia bacterium]